MKYKVLRNLKRDGTFYPAGSEADFENVDDLVDSGVLEAQQKEEDITKLKKDELIDLAYSRGIEAGPNDTKAQLIEKLNA